MVFGDTKEQRDEAIRLIRQGDKERGRQLLEQVVQQDPNDEYAWLWLSSVVPDDQKRHYCLERVLSINPQNEAAQRGLAKLPPAPPQPLMSPTPAAPPAWAPPPPHFPQYPPPPYLYPYYAPQPPSFTTKAVLTLVLYFIAWLPGLIANLVFLSEAKQVKERMWGQEPEGYGCLTAMLGIQVLVLLVLCALVFVG